MPDHLKGLVVILVLATAVFAFSRAPACAVATATNDFKRRRNLWFAVTLVAFLAHNFWLHIIVIGFLLFSAQRREPNKLAMFYFLLLALPPIEQDIPGMGILGALFVIHYQRLLFLAVLMPAFLFLRKQEDTERFGRLLPDKLMVAYFILNLLLMLPVSTFTNSLRTGVFYPCIDIFLPYYVASRSLKNLQGFRDVMMAYVVGALVISLIGAFEYTKHWLLYANLDTALGVNWAFGGYIGRAGDLRALGPIGQPIPFGYAIAAAMGFFVYLRKSVPNQKVWGLGMLLLIAGIISSLSRGPWVGAAVMLLVFVAIGPSPGLRMAKLVLLGVIVVPALLLSPFGEKIIDHLPFVGQIDAENVSYRQQLLETSIVLIKRNPFFGSYDFMNAPEMQPLIQGHGFIDLGRPFIDFVNTYAVIGLYSGLVGLSLFTGFFIAVLFGIFRGIRSLPDKNNEMSRLGQVLFSTLLGILLIIATVSSLSVVPIIYWSVAGLGVAYARMVALAKAPETAVPSRFQPATMKSGSYYHYRHHSPQKNADQTSKS
jgi:O-antigen ligase